MALARLLLAATLCLVAAIAFAAALPAVSGADPTTGLLLPDLDQAAPSQLVVTLGGTKAHPSYLLGFRSAVTNIGEGPLVIDGRREGRSRTMVADQLIARESGGEAVAPGIGQFSYVRSPDHQHWHLHGFDHYELRRAGTTAAVLVRDRKTGFCLGDRYKVLEPLVVAALQPQYVTRCGLSHPGLNRIREGISVGYGDDYVATLEYQSLPLDGLSDGRYVLVHRANADGRLRETRYDNNAASLLLDLRWRHGLPDLRWVATCPDSDACEAPRA
jgi:hypothetical protein